jgi:GTP-binding protein
VVLADIPGLIEGASRDRGLGLSFLRHVERTRLLLHVLDMSEGDADAVMSGWRVVRGEMEEYDGELGRRPCVVVGNKSDLCPDAGAKSAELAARFGEMGMEFTPVSALTGDNIGALMSRVIDFARVHPRPKSDVRMFADARVLGIDDLPQGRAKRQIQIVALPGGNFRVLHPKLEQAAERYDLSQEENAARFTKLLRKHRVEELLAAAGAAAGASVSIGRVDFDFYPDEYGE